MYKKIDFKKEEKKKFEDYLKNLNNQNIKNLLITSGNKRVEYFPEENI
jgi:hypothetical protein